MELQKKQRQHAILLPRNLQNACQLHFKIAQAFERANQDDEFLQITFC
jgi:hypothetical protein